MTIVHGNPEADAPLARLQRVLALLATALSSALAVLTGVWAFITPKANELIDKRVDAKLEVLGINAKHVDTVAHDAELPAVKQKIEALSGEVAAALAEIPKIEKQLNSLKDSVAEIRAGYGYSFRFKGSQIIAQRWPPNRVYFFAKRDDAAEIDIYQAGGQKLPVVLKVDGVVMRQIYRDSQQRISLTGRLTYTSLTELTPASQDVPANQKSPSPAEEPRPENLHYVEFLPGDVTFQFGMDDDFDISGIVRVWQPINGAKSAP